MTSFTIATIIALAFTQPVLAADWTQQTGSTLGFTGTTQGEAFNGQFKQFNAAIRFDPAKLDGARFDVTIELATVDSANAERDQTIKSADFFNVAQNPQAHYVAERFEQTADGFIAHGKLSLNGQTVDTPLQFQWSASADGAHLDGKAKLNRLDFKVGSGEWADPATIGTEVTVSTHLVLKPAG